MKIAILASISKTQYFINQAYVDYVKEAGLVPVVIPPGMPVEVAVDLAEGLLLPGGIDLDPIYYGMDNDTSYSVDPVKDEFERAMFHAFREADKPIFGICRGFQLVACEYLNAFPEMNAWMDFWDDIPYHQQTSRLSLERTLSSHFVEYVPHHLYGKDEVVIKRMPVNSMHHQCLYVDFEKRGVLGAEGFRMAAWTQRGLKIDKKAKTPAYPVVCEALRIFDWGAPILAVQWHPEEMRDLNLLANFFQSPNEVDAEVLKAKRK